MSQLLNLLLIEDNPGDADWVREQLESLGEYHFVLHHVISLREADAVLAAERIDTIILDLNLPDSRGIDTLAWARKVSEDIAVVVLSGNHDEDLRLFAFHEGAQDYIEKGGAYSRLFSRCILYAIERHLARVRQRQVFRIVAANPDAVIVTDTEGVVHFVNDAATRLFDKPREVLTQERLNFSVKEGEISEIEILRRDGKRSGEMHVVPFSWGDKPAFLAAIRDITEKKKLSEQLRQSQKMEAVGTLAGGIAHDFNNILGIILGNAHLAGSELSADTPVGESIQEIQKAAQRAKALVRQILTFSRRDEGEGDFKSIRLEPVIEDAIRFLRATIPANVRIISEFEPGMPTVQADAVQIQQILMNLGTNAAHAMRGRGGVLEVTLGAIDVSDAKATLNIELSSGRYARMSVRDTGSGMNPETVQRIFDPFFTTKPASEGTGLGLAVVHGIVKNHSGAITVYSEPDKGTLFHIYLPTAANEEAEREGDVPALIPGNREHIMYVDDEPALASLMERMLDRLNYRATSFTSPTEALTAFRESPSEFAAVVTDYSMPDLDGPHLVRELRAIRPDLPIAMATGYLRPQDLAAARNLGINQTMIKPGSIDDVALTLQSLLHPVPAPGSG